jgi:predicted small integral membrane protein
MPDLAWMAWTPETAVFFAAIALLLVLMILWGRLDPRNAPRKGILGIATQRGDRLFLSLLSAAFIHLAWIGLAGGWPLWGALLLSVVCAAGVFRFV